MQVIIVRLGDRFSTQPLREKVFLKLDKILLIPQYRTGVILILNACINVLNCYEI
jgi:hypothetical protein